MENENKINIIDEDNNFSIQEQKYRSRKTTQKINKFNKYFENNDELILNNDELIDGMISFN